MTTRSYDVLRYRCANDPDGSLDDARPDLGTNHLGFDLRLPSTPEVLRFVADTVPRCRCGAEMLLCSSVSFNADGTVTRPSLRGM